MSYGSKAFPCVRCSQDALPASNYCERHQPCSLRRMRPPETPPAWVIFTVLGLLISFLCLVIW